MNPRVDQDTGKTDQVPGRDRSRPGLQAFEDIDVTAEILHRTPYKDSTTDLTIRNRRMTAGVGFVSVRSNAHDP